MLADAISGLLLTVLGLYAAVKGQKIMVVTDGVAGPEYSNVVDMVFSADSKHLAYRALTGQQPVVVMDGKPTEPFDILTALTFSPDGTHYAYAALKGTTGKIYLDGVPLQSLYTAWVRDSRPIWPSNDAIDLLMARDRTLLQVRVQLQGKK